MLIIFIFCFMIIQKTTADWMNISGACKNALDLYMANLSNDSDEDNWALQSKLKKCENAYFLVLKFEALFILINKKSIT